MIWVHDNFNRLVTWYFIPSEIRSLSWEQLILLRSGRTIDFIEDNLTDTFYGEILFRKICVILPVSTLRSHSLCLFSFCDEILHILYVCFDLICYLFNFNWWTSFHVCIITSGYSIHLRWAGFLLLSIVRKSVWLKNFTKIKVINFIRRGNFLFLLFYLEIIKLKIVKAVPQLSNIGRGFLWVKCFIRRSKYFWCLFVHWWRWSIWDKFVLFLWNYLWFCILIGIY